MSNNLLILLEAAVGIIVTVSFAKAVEYLAVKFFRKIDKRNKTWLDSDDEI